MIRIALRSDHRLFRDTLAVCLDARPDCAVVGNVSDLDDLPVLCELRHPDLVLVDIGDGLGAGHEVLDHLRACVALARVIVMYERLSSAELATLWQLGVDTLLPCSHGFDALLVMLQRYIAAADGERRSSAAGVGDGLTDYEAKIIALLSAGHTVDRIARLLEISTSAVANTKRRIYRKLEVVSQGQAVARATALGLVTRPAARPARNGHAAGAVVATLRGAADPVRDRVTAVLLAGGIPVVADAGAYPRHPDEPEASAVVLVDPAPADWPDGRDAGLSVAIVRSVVPRRAEVLEALLRGAVAVVTLDRVATDLVPALTLAANGYVAVEAATLLDAVRTPSGPAPGLPQLTARESEILRSIANGHTVRQTARSIGIAEKTVENTQARLFRKLGARNRAGALATAHALGLVDLVPAQRVPV